MTEIYVIRHGKTVWNSELRMQGKMNSPLLPEGIEGALSLRPVVSEIPFDRVLSSPMPRALQTAYLATGGKFPMEVEPLLREMDLGDFEGMLTTDAKENYASSYDDFKHHPHRFEPVGDGESYYQVADRVKKLLRKILNGNDQTILLVSHMILVQSLLFIVEGREISTLRETPYVMQSTLYKLIIDEVSPGHYSTRILMRNSEETDESYEFTL